VWTRFKDWSASHPGAAVIDPRSLSRIASDATQEQFVRALQMLTDRNVVAPRWTLLQNNRIATPETFLSPDDIPESVEGRNAYERVTKDDADIVPVYVIVENVDA
jgi:hypothetical protein